MDRPAPVRSSHFVARQQSLLFKRGQPALHRPSAPSLVKDGGVAQDVVEMLNGRVYHRTVLMKSVRATDPAHRHSRRRRIARNRCARRHSRASARRIPRGATRS